MASSGRICSSPFPDGIRQRLPDHSPDGIVPALLTAPVGGEDWALPTRLPCFEATRWRQDGELLRAVTNRGDFLRDDGQNHEGLRSIVGGNTCYLLASALLGEVGH